ncbi:tetratricopeptide repeat protein [Lentzea tibetensis]|uniref:Tetratricopeptide repeat protein n=1 Tax=Lentzea tibetensis TaxID=2591470 RepID=A0A563ESS9_9PSEU|nr:tetratricopeptide repeat protein [Lentzea tibetensis]TWP50561.1 tetratricopeptide repeat protein [Lentzea tibetensis]
MRLGEHAEYVEFVRSRMPWLRKLAYLLCQDWHRADDVVQTAITQLFVHWSKARTADDVDAYARTVLTRAFLGERRSAWARKVWLGDTFDRPARAEDSTTAVAVRQALRAVPPRQRAVLVLRFCCDLSIEDTAVALESARRAGDRPGQALLLSGLGWLRAEQDRLDEAIDYYRQALECDENPVTRLLLASVLGERGDLAAALSTVDEVLPVLTDPRAVARAEHGRAMTLLELGDFPAARAGSEQALAAYQELGDGHGVGLVRRSIGIVFRAEGRLDDAAREGEEALRCLRAAGDRLMTVYAVQSLAKVRIRQGRGEEVRPELLTALDTCHDMQDGFGEALVRRTLGELELASGRFTEAIGHLRQALDWWESLNLTLWRARTLRDLAVALAAQGASAEAEATHQEAHRCQPNDAHRADEQEPGRGFAGNLCARFSHT